MIFSQDSLNPTLCSDGHREGTCKFSTQTLCARYAFPYAFLRGLLFSLADRLPQRSVCRQRLSHLFLRTASARWKLPRSVAAQGHSHKQGYSVTLLRMLVESAKRCGSPLDTACKRSPHTEPLQFRRHCLRNHLNFKETIQFPRQCLPNLRNQGLWRDGPTKYIHYICNNNPLRNAIP